MKRSFQLISRDETRCSGGRRYQQRVTLVRDRCSISAHLSDGCRDGEFVESVEFWALFEEEKPVGFSCIKCEKGK